MHREKKKNTRSPKVKAPRMQAHTACPEWCLGLHFPILGLFHPLSTQPQDPPCCGRDPRSPLSSSLLSANSLSSGLLPMATLQAQYSCPCVTAVVEWAHLQAVVLLAGLGVPQHCLISLNSQWPHSASLRTSYTAGIKNFPHFLQQNFNPEF